MWNIKMVLKVRAIQGSLPPKVSVPSQSFYPVPTPLPSFPLCFHPLSVGKQPYWFLVYSSSPHSLSFSSIPLPFFSFSVPSPPPLSPSSTNKQTEMYFLFLFFLHEDKYLFVFCFLHLKLLSWNQSIPVHRDLSHSLL